MTFTFKILKIKFEIISYKFLLITKISNFYSFKILKLYKYQILVIFKNKTSLKI